MATYSPSKITKDGNTYNFTDATKIPLAGTNALAGSIVPDTDNAYDFGSSSYKLRYIYCGGTRWGYSRISATTDNGEFNIDGGTGYGKGATLWLNGKDSSDGASFNLIANNGINEYILKGKPTGTLTWGTKNVAMQEDVIPRSGGAVLTGNVLSRAVNDDVLRLDGGTGWNDGASIALTGKNSPRIGGYITLHPSDGSKAKEMFLDSAGTWKWDGTACQITSDQRLKQQIAEIDDKRLDAWEDVEPSQFKYNDAVDQKGKDKARLHTGYVVQQIDSACKSHNVDISQYGLYCHEEYPQETEEVEVEQADGTKTKETKVIREASEHYSLRYTEALIVECAYLRKCIKELRTEIEQLKSSK